MCNCKLTSTEWQYQKETVDEWNVLENEDKKKNKLRDKMLFTKLEIQSFRFVNYR